jgi:hypothetical protein
MRLWVAGAVAALGIIGAPAMAQQPSAVEMQRADAWRAALALSVDGGRYDPAALAKLTETMVDLGAPERDARQAINALIDRGIPAAEIQRFGMVVTTVALVRDWSLPETARLIADGLTGGYDRLAALDDRLNFLEAPERQAIRQSFDKGEGEAARDMGLTALQRRSALAARALLDARNKNPAG